MNAESLSKRANKPDVRISSHLGKVDTYNNYLKADLETRGWGNNGKGINQILTPKEKDDAEDLRGEKLKYRSFVISKTHDAFNEVVEIKRGNKKSRSSDEGIHVIIGDNVLTNRSDEEFIPGWKVAKELFDGNNFEEVYNYTMKTVLEKKPDILHTGGELAILGKGAKDLLQLSNQEGISMTILSNKPTDFLNGAVEQSGVEDSSKIDVWGTKLGDVRSIVKDACVRDIVLNGDVTEETIIYVGGAKSDNSVIGSRRIIEKMDARKGTAFETKLQEYSIKHVGFKHAGDVINIIKDNSRVKN